MNTRMHQYNTGDIQMTHNYTHTDDTQTLMTYTHTDDTYNIDVTHTHDTHADD